MAANTGPLPRKGKYGKGVQRPQCWISGPDEYKHQMYLPFLRVRAQAKYRDEPFDLTFEEFFQVWNGLWDQRSRDLSGLCMTRIDWEGPWNKDNIEIISREEHLIKQGYNRRGTKYKPRKKRNV